MGEIVNLRQARKRRRRAEKESTAAESRRSHGAPKAEKAKTKRQSELEAKRLEAHRRDDRDDDR